MKKLLLIPVTGILAILASCQRYNGHMMGGRWDMNGYGHMMNYPYGGIVAWAGIILIIAFIGFAVYYFINKGKIRGEESALDILKKRYAKGEITREEYEKMKEII
jgi:putative membrane protein